jgi:putative FmdB family regulatory protein
MPVYDYHCDACGHTFEVFHGVDERPEVKCDRCGRPARKLFRPVPIIFKGSGWHVTDYGRGSYPKKREVKSPKQAQSPKRVRSEPQSITVPSVGSNRPAKR